jgi:hypothetical protein
LIHSLENIPIVAITNLGSLSLSLCGGKGRQSCEIFRQEHFFSNRLEIFYRELRCFERYSELVWQMNLDKPVSKIYSNVKFNSSVLTLVSQECGFSLNWTLPSGLQNRTQHQLADMASHCLPCIHINHDLATSSNPIPLSYPCFPFPPLIPPPSLLPPSLPLFLLCFLPFCCFCN